MCCQCAACCRTDIHADGCSKSCTESAPDLRALARLALSFSDERAIASAPVITLPANTTPQVEDNATPTTMGCVVDPAAPSRRWEGAPAARVRWDSPEEGCTFGEYLRSLGTPEGTSSPLFNMLAGGRVAAVAPARQAAARGGTGATSVSRPPSTCAAARTRRARTRGTTSAVAGGGDRVFGGGDVTQTEWADMDDDDRWLTRMARMRESLATEVRRLGRRVLRAVGLGTDEDDTLRHVVGTGKVVAARAALWRQGSVTLIVTRCLSWRGGRGGWTTVCGGT